MTRLAFRTILILLLLNVIADCGALKYAVPSGTNYARPPGPPQAPGTSAAAGGFAQATNPPDAFDFFFFPGLFGNGSGFTGGTESGTTPNTSNPPQTGTNGSTTDASTSGGLE